MEVLQRSGSLEEHEPFAVPRIPITPAESGNAGFFHLLEALVTARRSKTSKGDTTSNNLDLDNVDEADESDEEAGDSGKRLDYQREAAKLQDSDQVKQEMEADEKDATGPLHTPQATPAQLDAASPTSDYIGEHGVSDEELEQRLAALTRQAIVPEGEAQGVFKDSSTDKAEGTTESDTVSPTFRRFPGTYVPSDSKTDPATDPRRLQLLRNAFGPCDYLPNESEQFITESQGMLVGQVLVKGRLFLTNTRLIFYALLPSLEKERDASHVLKAGPVTSHFGVKIGNKTRYYAVLTRDTISLNKTSKDLYSPSGMLGLNDIVRVIEPNDVFDTHLTFEYIQRMPNGQRHIMTNDTECDSSEEAISWRRELSSAVFAFQNKRDRYRASLPLDRIVSADRVPYFRFSMLANVIVEKEPGDLRNLKLGVPSGEDHFWEKVDAAIAHVTQATVHIPEVDKPISEAAVVDLFSAPGSDRPSVERSNSADSGSKLTQVPSLTDEDMLDDGDVEVPADKIARRKLRLAAAHQIQPEDITSVYHAELPRLLSPISGVLGCGPKGVAFFARRAMGDTKLRIPTRDIQGAKATSALRFSTYGLRILVRGHEDIEFELHSREKRDNALRDILAVAELKTNGISATSSLTSSASSPASPPLSSLLSDSTPKSSPGSIGPPSTESPLSEAAPSIPDSTRSLSSRKQQPGNFGSFAGARKELPFGSFVVGGRKFEQKSDLNVAALDEHMQTASFKPMRIPLAVSSLIPRAINFELDELIVPGINICFMTIGSRGDVQPYIALSRRCLRSGHKVTIATHPEYKDWVKSFGIEHRAIGGDPTLLMQVSVEHKIFSLDTIKRFRKWMDDLLDESYEAVKGMDVVVESPSTMAGIHVCEARKIPYIRAFTMPWTRTKAFPHAFMSQGADNNGSFNYSTYILFENLMWKASSGQVNRFRHKIGLQSTDLDKMKQRDIPFIYNFSTAVVPRPLDWPEHVQVSGYWFLDTDLGKWTPPEKLAKFLDDAKAEQKPIVYIGFGSITVQDPTSVTKAVIEAVEQTGVACILCKGWSGRGHKESEEITMPRWILQLASVPHDWLFERIDAAMHHGGAGTTAASLRAGIPTLIKPFFGDQYFWARTVTNNGSGLRVHSLSAKDMADAISHAVGDRIMREKAEQIGEKLRAEDGLGRAIKFLNLYYVRALKKSGAGYSETLKETHEKLHGGANPFADASLDGRFEGQSPIGAPLEATRSNSKSTTTSTIFGGNRSSRSPTSASRSRSPSGSGANTPTEADTEKHRRRSSILQMKLPSLPGLHRGD